MDSAKDRFNENILKTFLFRIPDGTTTLDTLDGGSLTIQRTIDDIFSEGVTVRSSQATAKIVQLNIQASDGVIHAIDTVL